MGEEVQHIISYDSNGIPLEGSKNYKLNLSPNIPVREFWSVIVYDCQNRLIIQSRQPWPSVHCKSRRLVVNDNGSVDVWFGPEALAGKVNNWILTIPGRGWNMILHLYDPLESWFNKTWRPGKIEEVK
jgi:hypothetical protein